MRMHSGPFILPQFESRFEQITSQPEWYALTVEIHNAVNRKLGKPEYAYVQPPRL